jgi:hypothetical protein
MTALYEQEATPLRTRRLSDAEVVELALAVLAEPRAWAAGEMGAVAPYARQEVVRRAGRLLREALATV